MGCICRELFYRYRYDKIRREHEPSMIRGAPRVEHLSLGGAFRSSPECFGVAGCQPRGETTTKRRRNPRVNGACQAGLIRFDALI